MGLRKWIVHDIEMKLKNNINSTKKDDTMKHQKTEQKT